MAQAVAATGHNPKPVVLRSARVGLALSEQAYGRDAVLAGVLHDLLEDTAVATDAIRRAFGDGVLRLVAATTSASRARILSGDPPGRSEGTAFGSTAEPPLRPADGHPIRTPV